ncbi:DUF2125 domain-containing protein [Tropicimonas sp. IMCC6043]|uniref:DUF2125 domain-containing protein n=1 Tax=Tropicimonas sp. IMCC6043 TaxID=2510645 RepID=UPI00101DDF81|nr:DUF2125 domain-containing protein [Tropicimonas sp. IMCC6043]RYH09287.1 DUF2125 domain-containing protein [Tropicimonas sp. IMCC6043]
MLRPIRLLWLVALFAVGWSAWWGWGAWRAQTGLESWMEARRDAGWLAEWDRISVAGFPTRIDRTISGLVLANPAGGWVLTMPFFQILGLNYEPNHLVLVWPDEMELATPQQRIAISGADLKGSVTFRPGPAREVEAATLVFKDIALASDSGWTSRVGEFRLATRPAAGADAMRDIGLEIIGLKPRSPALEQLADAGILPGEVETLKADLAISFDRPWDRRALEEARPQPREIRIREIAVRWGALELRLAGSLSVDAEGAASGEVMVKSTNWREMLDLARQSGAIPDSFIDTIDSAFTLLSGLAGRKDTLDIPLTLREGRMSLGPVPLGRAPRLRLP